MRRLETEKMELRSTIKALDFHKSRVACKMAEDLGITGSFLADELPFDDPRINQEDVETYQDLSDRLYNATWKYSKLDFIDEPERAVARQTCFDFINLLSLDETISFLDKVGCYSTSEFIEKLIKNPNLIEETVLEEGV